jgi:hypothetical protein
MEFMTFIIYGHPCFKKFPLSGYKLNTRDPSILMNDDKPYITNVPFSFWCKYHIEGIGTIPKWSKLHRDIERKFDELLKE